MEKRLFYPWWLLNKDIKRMVDNIKKLDIKAVYGFPRGGLIVAVMFSNYLNIPLITDFSKVKSMNKDDVLIVDDIADSGKTMLAIPKINLYRTATLFVKKGSKFMPMLHCNECADDVWVIFPWEPRESKAERDGTLKNV